VILNDLNSKNGTWVNGVQVKGKTDLHDGDEVNLAMCVRLKYVAPGSTVPLPFAPPEVIGGRLRLDREAHRVFINGKEIDPPSAPLNIACWKCFTSIPVMFVLVKRSLIRSGPKTLGEGVSEQAIDALVRRLRDRLYELEPAHQYIVTMRGHGFRLNNPHN
jgi:DNA-binding response OmpR family regulator